MFSSTDTPLSDLHTSLATALMAIDAIEDAPHDRDLDRLLHESMFDAVLAYRDLRRRSRRSRGADGWR